jgi:hypothetical protein
MTQRLKVEENEDPEQVRKGLDNELGVTAWTVPGRKPLELPDIDPRAPLWWQGDEEASSSFLAAYGITLTDDPLPGEVTPDG